MILTATDLERIDASSVRILGELGLRVDDAALREAAIRAGAAPGDKADWIRIPPEMVRDCVAMAPSQVTFAGAGGGATTVAPGGTSTFWTGAALNYVDGAACRSITGSDLRDFCRLADRMEHLMAVVGTSVAEAPPPVRDVAGLAIMAAHTRKHLRPLLFSPDSVPAMIEIAQVVADGASLAERPLISFGYSCLPPLHWAATSTELWRRSSRHALPLMLNGEPITGTTSPVTLAGSLALAHAEVLGGVVLVQLLEPGRPVIHNVGFAHSVDMRTAACLSGTPECALLAAAGAALAAHHGLPSASWMCTDAFTDDEQASLEKMLTGMAHADAGVNVIWGMGQLESEKTLSPVQLVIDNDLAGMLRRWRSGIVVNDDTLAFDVIRDVVEGRGDFLSHDHTLNHFRTALSESPLMTRTHRDTWQAAGAATLARRARAQVDAILAEPAVPVLRGDQLAAIAAIRDKAFSRLK